MLNKQTGDDFNIWNLRIWNMILISCFTIRASNFRLIRIGFFPKLLSLLIIAASCANPVAPTGGPKDTKPPRIIESAPENGSVHFRSKEIKIWFDEFVQLKGLQQQFISSPPFDKTPDVRIKGKSLVIRLEEELRPNTTYTLFFGDAISDFNEGNPISNFRYFFSTGPVLDSMELSGTVFNARTLKPEKEVLVMLYDTYTDSVPMQQKPYYISRTDKNGHFHFTNLRDIPYKIFTLRDVNANLIYDMPNEEIAFLEELVLPILPALIPDHDTIAFGNHLVNDSIARAEMFRAHTVYLFTETDSTQHLVKAEYNHPNRLMFAFRFPVSNLTILPEPGTEADWILPEYGKNNDTLWYWLRNVDRDTLSLIVSADRMKTDTLQITLTKYQSQKKDQTDAPTQRLGVQSNIPRSGAFNLNDTIRLQFSEPIATVNTDRIWLYYDSIPVEPEIRFVDSVHRTLNISYVWADTSIYRLLIPDSVFFSIYGFSNDTIEQKFKTRSVNDYGKLTLNIGHNFSIGQLLIRLHDGSDKLIQELAIGLDEPKVEFPFLLPGKYSVQMIHDANLNRRWDAGVYLEKLQPERVYIFDKPIEIRANWELEESFKVNGQ